MTDFTRINEPSMAGWALVVAAVGVASAVWAYHGPGVRLSNGKRGLLAGLRSAWGLVLAMLLLQPVLLHPFTDAERGRVVIVLDASASMTLHDPELPPDRQVAIADAAGWIGAGVRPAGPAEALSALERLSESLEQLAVLRDEQALHAGLPAAKDVESPVDQAVQRLTASAGDFAQVAAAGGDDMQRFASGLTFDPVRPISIWRDAIQSARQGLGQMVRDADRKLLKSTPAVAEAAGRVRSASRLMLAESLLNQPGRGLLAMLPTDVPRTVLVGRGDARVTPFAAGTAIEPATPQDTDLPGWAVEASGSQTAGADVGETGGGMSDDLADGNGGPVRAVVLLTDGRNTAPTGRPNGVRLPPVHTVLIGDRGPQPDVAITAVRVPQRAYVGETIKVEATIVQRGGDAKDVTVEIAPPDMATSRDGADALGDGAATKVDDRSGVEIHGEPPESEVDLQTLEAAASLQASRVSWITQVVRTDPKRPVTVRLEVQADRPGLMRPMVRIDAGDDDAVPANNAMAGWCRVVDRRLSIAVVDGSLGWDGQFLRDALRNSRWASFQEAVLPGARVLAMSPQEIDRLDLLVLIDVPTRAMSPSQWVQVNRAVRERGMVLMLVAGERAIPDGWQADVMASSLLPFEPSLSATWRSWPGEKPGLGVVPSPLTPHASAVRLEPGGSPELRWQTLPGMFRLLTLPSLRTNVEPLLIEPVSGEPVATAARLGAGRVLFVGLTQSWRWRVEDGGAIHDRFWLGLIRYFVGEPYAGGDDRLMWDIDPAIPRPGERIRVRARATDPAGGLVGSATTELQPSPPTAMAAAAGGPTAAKAWVAVVRSGGVTIQTAALAPGSVPGRWTGQLTGLPRGEYEMSVEPADAPSAAAMRRSPVSGGFDSASAQPGGLELLVAYDAAVEFRDPSAGRSTPMQLARLSGGSVVNAEEAQRVVDAIVGDQAGSDRYRVVRLWDNPAVFGLLLGALTLEWALRKWWGMA